MKRISKSAIRSTILLTAALSCLSGFAQDLRSLPRMRAIPLGKSTKPDSAPDALQTPSYCDSETLRDSATLRAIHFGNRDAFGIAAGDHGTILRSLDGGETWKTCLNPVHCMLNDAIVLNDQYAVAIGGGIDHVTSITRGVVLVSNDAGQTWRRGQDTELPRLRGIRAEQVNNKTVLFASGDVDPVTGASQFRSRDGGRTWEPILGESDRTNNDVGSKVMDPRRAAGLARATATNATLRASCQLRDGTWLMVGDHGHILRSTDGGESWREIRAEDNSTAVLFIVSRVDRIPWSLVGREALEQRMRTSIVVASTDNADAAQEAAMRLGVSSLETLAPGTDQASALTDWIDVHRPPVVALDATLSKDLRGRLLAHAVGIGSQKVVEFTHEQRGESVLHRGALLPECGALAGDFEVDSWLITGDDLRLAFDPTRQQIGTRTRYSTSETRSLSDSLASGVRLSRSQRLPPREIKASRRLLQIAQARLQQQAAIEKLLSDSHDAIKIRESIDQMLRQTDRPDRFRRACLIVARAHGTRHEQTAWQLFSERFPGSSAGSLAALRKQTRDTSLEWAQLEQRFRSAAKADTRSDEATGLPIGRVSHAAIVSPFQTTTENPIVQTSASLPLQPVSKNNVQESSNATIRELDLAWQMHPVRLIADDAIRNRRPSEIHAEDVTAEDDAGDTSELPMVEPDRNADLDRIAARDADWSLLLKPESPQVVRAMRAGARPLLDGKLNEPLWAQAAETRSTTPIQIRVAYDDQFLYVATETQAGALSPETESASSRLGKRDAELGDRSRICLRLDVDRDLFTAFELEWTPAGRTRDSIDEDVRWDPTWYVASAGADGTVTTELALSRESLGIEIEPGDSWMIEVHAVSAGDPVPRAWMPRSQDRVRIDF